MPKALYEFGYLTNSVGTCHEPNSGPKKIKFTKIWIVLNCLQLLLVKLLIFCLLSTFNNAFQTVIRSGIFRALSFAQFAVIPLIFYGKMEIVNDFQQNDVEFISFDLMNAGMETVCILFGEGKYCVILF
jgi:hypothetical protein